MITYEINCQDPILSKFINGYTILEFNKVVGNKVVKLPPMGFPVIQFHYGTLGDFYIQPERKHPALVVGQMTQHVYIKPENGVKFIGVNLKPYGLYNLFGYHPIKITDKTIPLQNLMSEIDVAETLAGIHKTLEKEDKINIIEAFLKKIVWQKKKYHSHAYDFIADKIVEKNGLLRMEEFMNDKVKLRNLQRYFREHIGIPPKLFMQIYRHRFVVSNLLKSPSFNWKDPMLDGYYYDQSHFDRDFRRFAFENPSTYTTTKHLLVEQLS